MWNKNKNKVLVVAVLLLFYTSISTQVAPGDEDERCLTLNQNDAVDPTVTILMDSRNYIQLLEADGAVWDQRDFDENNPSGAFTSTYFRHNAGGVCRWTVMSCGYRSGAQDNWLFTQYINKNAPPNTDYDVTLHVKLLYTLSNCRERHGCNPVIGVYIFNTTDPQERDVYTDPTNYHLLTKRSGASALTQTLNIKADIPPEFSGFYIAIHDDTSCIQLSQMKVFRHQCQRKQEGLVIFPETAAPVDTPLNVTTKCVANSHFVTDPVVECQRTGRWSGSAECVCDPGFVKKKNSGGEFFCEPCPAGTYRSATDSQDRCKRCPANTAMDVVAAPMCQCLTGYFRNTEGLEDECPANQIFEDAASDCTKPPSMPLDLNATYVTDTNISIKWSHPEFLGGRDDHYYIVQYSDPDNVGEMFVMRCVDGCLNETQCTITGLKPATKYIIRVTAHNGVSDQDKGGALARQVEISVITDNAPPSVPLNILPFCDVIVWEEPGLPNGEIKRYDIMFVFQNGSSTTIAVLGQNTYYVIGIGTTYEEIEIKVRAVNDAGAGPYSEPNQLACGEVETPAGMPVGCPVCPVVPSPSPVPADDSVCPSLPVATTTVSVSDIRTATVTETATINATVTTTLPMPTTVAVTVPTTVAITVPTTTTINATVTETVPVPTTVAVTIPTTVTINATVTETVPVPTTVATTIPTTVAVTIPTTVTTTAIINATVTETVPVPTTVAVTVPTTVTTTATINATVTETVPVPTTVATTIPTTVAVTVPTIVTTTATINATVTETVPVPTTVAVTTTIAVPVPTTVTTTTTTTTTSTMIPSPSPCTTSPPIDSTPTATTTTTVVSTVLSTTSTPATSSITASPSPCPTDAPSSVIKPTFFFFTSQQLPKPGNVANVKLLSCGVLVWDPPANRDCYDDHMTYKIRIYNGTSFSSTEPSQRAVLWVDTTWVKLTESCMPCARPLHITIKARKDDGAHSTDWSEPITMTESHVIDCPW